MGAALAGAFALFAGAGARATGSALGAGMNYVKVNNINQKRDHGIGKTYVQTPSLFLQVQAMLIKCGTRRCSDMSVSVKEPRREQMVELTARIRHLIYRSSAHSP